jgi:hypothetical protein
MVKRRKRGATAALLCPYCGQPAEVGVDLVGGGEQDADQDCAVCCRPWRVHLEADEDGVPTISLHREDD